MIDLHLHSQYSEDGEYSPEELVRQCYQKGVRILSITDHNCVRANETALKAAKRKDMDYIPGIEIDCVHTGNNLHILGYDIDFHSPDFQKLEAYVNEQNLRVSLETLEKTQTLGFHVTEGDMWALSKDRYWKEAWTGEMFAEVLLEKPEYADHPILQPYRPGGKRGGNPLLNFYWDYYSQGKCCYVPRNYPTAEEIIDVIHRNHGIAVLAHPGLTLRGRENLLDDILELGIDGVEAFSSYHTSAQTDYFVRYAKEKKRIITCGSDIHGKIKPLIEIGQYHCSMPDEELYERTERVLERGLKTRYISPK